MIVKMSKVEIAGPRDLLQSVLSLLQDMELLQIEPSTVGFIEKKEELKPIKTLLKKSEKEYNFLKYINIDLEPVVTNAGFLEKYFEPIFGRKKK